MSSVKDSRRRRHSRQPYSQSGKIHTHLSPPSALSLLSTSTSGSNSTVIPDRFLRSGLRPSKRQESKRPVTRTSVPTKDSQTESVGNHSDKENVTAVLSSNRWELKKTTIKEPVSKVSVTKEASPVKLARREPAQGEPAEAKPAPMEQASVAKVRIGSRAKKRANDHSDVFAFMVKDGQEVDSDAEKAEKEEEGEEQQKGAQGEEDGDEKEDEEGEEEEEEDDEDEDEAEGKVEDADESDEDDQQGNATNNVNIAPSTFSTSTHGSHPTLSSSCDFETGAPPKIEQQQHIWRRSEASLHSDSGISVRSSSPERESPAPRHRHPHVRKLNSYGGTVPNPSYPGYYPPAPMPPVAYVPRTPAYPRDWSTYGNPMENPEVYYASTRPVVTQTMQRPARLPPPDHQPRNHQLIRGPPHPQTEKPARQKKSGYDELAAAIDSRGDAFLKPIYRKFETLNHRILLYLQDEISETEEELRELDLAITLEEQMLGNTHASRRTEAKLPSQLQWRRLELLNRSYTKIEQYNRALSSYTNLTQSLEPASKADINTYKSWISENAPIVEQETTFLRKERDLIAVSPKHSSVLSSPSRKASYSQLMGSSCGPRSREEIETPVFIVAFTLLSTIIVFKVVPMILARLVISAVFGVATLGTIAPGVLSSWGKGLKEWKKGIAIYTGVMLVLAFVVS